MYQKRNKNRCQLKSKLALLILESIDPLKEKTWTWPSLKFRLKTISNTQNRFQRTSKREKGNSICFNWLHLKFHRSFILPFCNANNQATLVSFQTSYEDIHKHRYWDFWVYLLYMLHQDLCRLFKIKAINFELQLI